MVALAGWPVATLLLALLTGVSCSQPSLQGNATKIVSIALLTTQLLSKALLTEVSVLSPCRAVHSLARRGSQLQRCPQEGKYLKLCLAGRQLPQTFLTGLTICRPARRGNYLQPWLHRQLSTALLVPAIGELHDSSFRKGRCRTPLIRAPNCVQSCSQEATIYIKPFTQTWEREEGRTAQVGCVLTQAFPFRFQPRQRLAAPPRYIKHRPFSLGGTLTEVCTHYYYSNTNINT